MRHVSKKMFRFWDGVPECKPPPLFVAFAPSPWTPVVDLRSLDPLIYSILTLAPFQTHVLDASPTAIE